MPKQKKSKKQFSPKSRFLRLLSVLRGMVVEKEDEILCLAVALLARENVLILGKPGAAKTMLAKLFCYAISDATWFYYLLSKTTEPNEIFGPVNPAKFRDGEFVRITKGMAPEAHLLFLDEVFKGNSSINNAMLTLINEHQFQNGTDGMVDCPTEMVVGCSNELPEDEKALAAFYDRFPIRKWSGYITSQDRFKTFLMSEKADKGKIDKDGCKLSLRQLHELQDATQDIAVYEPVIDVLIQIKKALLNDRALQLEVSDRKWEKLVSILRAHAYIHGRDEVTEDDLMFLPHCLWNKPDQLPQIAKVVSEIANPLAALSQELLDACKEEFRTLGDLGRDVPDSESAAVMQLTKTVMSKLRRAKGRLEGENQAHCVVAAIKDIKTMQASAAAFITRVVNS
jgi:MoxR-like ATPase